MTVEELLNASNEMEIIKIIRDATAEDFKDVPDMAWLMIADAFIQYYIMCMSRQIGVHEVSEEVKQ